MEREQWSEVRRINFPDETRLMFFELFQVTEFSQFEIIKDPIPKFQFF